VHKDDLLMVIDPTNYRIAVSQAEAAVQQSLASVQNIEAQIAVQRAQISVNQAELDRAQAALVFAQQQAVRYQYLAQKGSGTVQNAQQFASQLRQQEAGVQTAKENLNLAQRQVESLKAQRMSAEATVAQAKAQLSQAQVDLERTRILSPVDGYVTNLLARLSDFVEAGVNSISVVDANSFWVDGYFEETNLVPIRMGDAAQAYGPRSDRAWSRRQHRPSDQRCERAAEQSRGRKCQPHLHLGAPGAAHPGAHPYR
jgi:multidrug resistance efflux pump